MIRLSIVVPACRNQQTLDQTLLSLLENRPADSQVIVACTERYEDPHGLDDEVQFVRTAAGDGWPALANRGLAASQGDIVHLLEPGAVVEEGWTEPAMEVLQYEQEVSTVSPLVFDAADTSSTSPVAGVRLDDRGQRIELGCTDGVIPIRNFQVLGPSRRAGFYRRSALLAIGGWDPLMGELYADIDLGCTLALSGGTCKVVPSCQVKTIWDDRVSVFTFADGINAQRLIRRYRELSNNRLSLAALFDLASPKLASYVLGRLVGCAVGTKRRTAKPAKGAASFLEEHDSRAAG